MKRLIIFMTLFVCATWYVNAAQIKTSTALPDVARPEHLYTMSSGNGYYANAVTAPTQTRDNYGLFAFYEAGQTDVFYIYSYKAGKWLSYDTATGYANQRGFLRLSETKTEGACFKVSNYADGLWEIQPYTTSGTTDKYLNWFEGIGQNPLDGTTTLGLWQDNGSGDAGSRWIFTELVIKEYRYTVSVPDGVTLYIAGKAYPDGSTYTREGVLTREDVSVVVGSGQFAAVAINNEEGTVSVYVATLPNQATKNAYTRAVLYPVQQDAVGVAELVQENDTYTLSNKVLAASFMKVGGALYFAGSKAMNLVAGTEPFTVAFGNGDQVAASGMRLKGIRTENLTGDVRAVGGAEHYNGKALVAEYEYTYEGQTVDIVWRAILRDGSHYLRTEMELTGVGDVDMYNVIPLIYNVDTKAAGSTPAVVGNTRGAVLMSNRIFAGLENPVGYNTVGDASGEDNKWELAGTLEDVPLSVTDWVRVAAEDVPDRVTEATGASHPNVYVFIQENITLKANQKVEIKVEYTGGSHRLNLGGVDLLDTGGSVAANDYHSGYSGNAHDKNTFTMIAPNDGTFAIRVFVEDKTESITATGRMSVKLYNAKEGAIISSDIVGIQGRWSRNTILEAGETWKISGVVGLIAQDGKEAEAAVHKTQKRRSFLAYSERERAVPWRANPCYISWYELNINRNNAQDPTGNMTAEQVLNVQRHWKNDFYDRYGIGPHSFVIDDGWDNYGTWTFHAKFPNEMRDIAALAQEMGSGVGAWLGPVGGYGTSGNYRRAYWNTDNRGGMILSNPAYYKVFKEAAENLTTNQGDFNFFKFDGISAQFSATGPDAGDTGNENAEGIIRLERFVREELKRDIFFNTTVGTWASPFWYHYTDATWRQENDYGTIGNNRIDRENWMTYRDRLVYQNYVSNSPVCPINTLMTHGFILTKFGNVSKNMTYDAVLRELRCAFVCGSGMVELYNDYDLMNSINKGQLWADLAECIRWQKRNADVLPDAHWVGGNPWNGSSAEVYGWASWNGSKATLALRNGSNDIQSYVFTLREALNIPANVDGSIILNRSFGVQDALQGLSEGIPIHVDDVLTVTLPGSSVYCFDGIDAATARIPVSVIALHTESDRREVVAGNTLVVTAVANADATFPAIAWSSSNEEVATVNGGLVQAVAEGEVTIAAMAQDGSGTVAEITLNVIPKPVEPYAVNFDKEVTPSRTDRWIKQVTLTDEQGMVQTIEVGKDKCYFDKTTDERCILKCAGSARLTAAFNIEGNWMNGYVYIDKENDKQFSFRANSTDQTNTDVVSFSFFSGDVSDDASGVNSEGTVFTGQARNTRVCPAFQAPAQAGDYRIRFKLDWNSMDAGGSLATDGTATGSNGILGYGGAIVDAILRVSTNGTGIEGPETAADGLSELYDLAGRRLVEEPQQGIFIKDKRKVLK